MLKMHTCCMFFLEYASIWLGSWKVIAYLRELRISLSDYRFETNDEQSREQFSSISLLLAPD